MKIKIGFLIEQYGLGGMDLSSIDECNPGIGGTAYCILTVVSQLSKRSEYEVYLYSLEELIFERDIKQIVVKDKLDAVEKVSKNGLDVFVFVAKSNEPQLYKKIEEKRITAIAWVHNFIDYPVLKLLRETSYIRRIVFVGQQHYDYYIDDSIIDKSTYIYNIVPPKKNIERIRDDSKNVVYVGMLGPAKGFHVLAKAWKNIVRKVPDAKLYVIGSADLYRETKKRGKYGLAEKQYEDRFIKYLVDSNGELLPSVKFCGTLGVEKEDLYKTAAVGVVNPSGVSETFCLSAVEMETRSIPVVSYRGKGLLDTVIDSKTGFLRRSTKGVQNSIIKLLRDKNANVAIGRNAKEFVDNSFSPEIVMPKWDETISNVLENKIAENEFSKRNMWDCAKWVKYIMFRLKHKVSWLNVIPSCAYTERYLKTLIKKLIERS